MTLILLLKDSKLHSKICIRAIFIKILLQGSSIKDASNTVGVARQTGSRWLKRYNEECYNGLIPKFDGGKPGQLNDNRKKELKNILIDENGNYTITEVVKLIKEKYGVEFSYKRIWS